ncbi:SET domain-containing protein [Phthorimaea operculella]|nr:SET domain-containing protein [Phthorimaea operculella]
MSGVKLPEDCSKQWEILLLLLSSEEKKIDRTGDNEIDTMNYFTNNEGVRKILLQWMSQMMSTYAKKTSDSDTALKSDEVSLLWRQRGNEKFRANNLEGSYNCYTKSVLYAAPKGPMYPLALANRSAALLRMKRFKECLEDIGLAIDNGYPLSQRHKLLLRRSDCLIELGRKEDAKHALEDATKQAATLNLSPTLTAEFDRHIKMLERKMEEAIPQDTEEEDPVQSFRYLSLVTCDSSRSELAGRHVAATEAVRRGDVLFSELPYAWVTLEGDTCEFCCQPRVNLVPCETCSRSIYCSVGCRERARQEFHQWECVGAQADIFLTIGIAHLALRVLLITASKGFPPVPSSQRTPKTALDLFNSYAAVDNLEIYKTDTPAFYRMFNLVTNFDKMNNSDYIQYALTATLLTLYLETYTSFFEYLPTRIPYPLPALQLRLFAAALMLRALGQLVCNGHATLSLDTVEDGSDNGRTVTEREVRRATAIYPSAAMMNHSCDPNIINTFHNSRLIIRCARELAPGGEVLNCYGPHRARSVTAQRRAQLRAQYSFTCNCAACASPEHRDVVVLNCYGPHRARSVTAQRRAQLRAQYSFTCNCAACASPEHRDVVVLNCYGPHRARSVTAQRRAQLRAQYSFTCNCAACASPEHRDVVVLNCYGPHRARSVTAQRRAQLRAQYSFTCNCAACASPEYRDVVLLFTAYACQSCKGPVVWTGKRATCQQCHAEFQLEKALAAIDRADELQAQADRAASLCERCSILHAALRLKQQVWHRHHTGLREPADRLARLYADAGEFSKSVELIKQNIQSLEYQFGSFSVEVAHELRKLADVMLERMINSPQNPDYRDWCLETHKIIKKAVQLMELNYGSWEPLVKRLRQQESMVAAHLADSRTPDSADCVHNTLHYNLKI